MSFKQSLLVLFTLISTITFSQKGEVSGQILDADMNNDPLPFANVYVKGTQVGAQTDFDGNYSFYVEEGTHTLVFSFIGYETKEIQVNVIADETTTVESVSLGASEGVALDEVVVTATATKASETALLSAQKNSTVIVESIGTERLTKLGVSSAASATSKISGVTKNEGSGDIYVRGLGDRYLSTTMNGLPIPSDDVEKKNINLELFSTDVMQNVGITKTYSTSNYVDQASGNVNVSTRYGAQDASISLRVGSNSLVAQSNVWNNFKATQNINDTQLGFNNPKYSLNNAITQQSWNTETRNFPMDYKLRFTVGKKINKISLFFTGSQFAKHSYQEGVFRSYRSNVLDNSFDDATYWTTKIGTNALFDIHYDINEDHKISFNTLFINTMSDNVYEAGRDERGYVFDQDPSENGAFVRDQNTKQTTLLINQLLGKHFLSEKNQLEWAIGYNTVNADEPNRIRNEVNIGDGTDIPDGVVQFAHVSDFQQRKTSQEIVDNEINGFIKDQLKLNSNEENPLKLNFGVNGRRKTRDFESKMVGVRAKGVQTNSIDDLTVVFTQQNVDNGVITIRDRKPDTYNGTLTAYAGFANLDFKFNKFSGNIGARYEMDEIQVDWDVANYVGREGSTKKSYNNLAPSINLKYSLNDISALRFAGSQTTTLPEFKELAPFNYVSPTGRVTAGNPDLIASTNYNFDLKYEIFPTSKELISVTSFYKIINDPINQAQLRGSSGYFSFFNTGEQATVLGFEFEGRYNFLKSVNPDLDFSFNYTRMFFEQDLYEEFQYDNKTSTGLQGAAENIVNGALSFTTNTDINFGATLSGNYSSEKILAMGSPESLVSSDVLYNDEIIEEGFATLNLVLRLDLNEHLSFNVRGLNLTNPTIEQTQKVRDINDGLVRKETVMSYKNGIDFRVGVRYSF